MWDWQRAPFGFRSTEFSVRLYGIIDGLTVRTAAIMRWDAARPTRFHFRFTVQYDCALKYEPLADIDIDKVTGFITVVRN